MINAKEFTRIASMFVGFIALMLPSGKVLADNIQVPKLPAPKKWTKPENSGSNKGLQRLVKYIPRLRYSQNGRWPLLIWGRLPKTEAEMQAWIERGISPAGQSFRKPEQLARLKQMQDNGVPLILLSQGGLQNLFRDVSHGKFKGRKGMLGCDHLPPALPERKNRYFTCPAFMMECPGIDTEAGKMEGLCNLLKNHGIKPTALFIDFETGAYLRNRAERASNLEPARAQAAKCPRCLKRFGKERPATMDQYSDCVEEARAFAIKAGFVSPVHKVFPECNTGNFFAWPVKRKQAKDDYSAYGYMGSGMNVAQPRQYLTAGWGGCGSDEKMADWIALRDCVATTSKCAKVLKPGEIPAPWIGLVRSRKLVREKRGNVYPSVEGFAEIARHLLLRGAETVFVFNSYDLSKDFPANYGGFPRKERGPWIMYMEGLQRGYDDMLRFNQILRDGKVMNLEVEGDSRKLDDKSAMWSGVEIPKIALVRTVTFGKSFNRKIKVFNRQVSVPFAYPGILLDYSCWTGYACKITLREKNP